MKNPENSMTWEKNKKFLFLCSLLLCAFLYFSIDALFRPLWFDEALTLLEFVTRPRLMDIYRCYEIPNNHIIFNIILKLWMSIHEKLFSISDFSFRIFSFSVSLSTIFYLFTRWKKIMGTYVSFIIVLALICSMPFEIYCVAIRGYMLSFLLTALSFDFCASWLKKQKLLYAVLFFSASLLSVGTMPSNLIALCAILIYFFPFRDIHKAFRYPYIIVALLPATALICFYAPIYSKFIKIFSLKEGCGNHFMVILSVYGAFIVSFLPLLIPAATAGSRRLFRKAHIIRSIPVLLIIALPLPFIFMKTPAPFPRIFFPLWPVWLIILGLGLKSFLCLRGLRMEKHKLLIFISVSLCVLIWGLIQKQTKAGFSTYLSDKNSLDDYFQPYYQKNFDPPSVVKEIAKRVKENPMPIYATFQADPYSLVFYGKLLDVPDWRYDNPRENAKKLESGNALAVVHNDDEIEKLKEKSGAKKAFLIKSFGYQKLYQLSLE
ncbi:MAG: hypothetical protein A2017_09295 [Lentisphaerae bacterium GWF2_44_16]|nr:MAG: hypothetical protein A2017_09295 [Lentisphaerae bacterium GWF2_44_16]